MHFLGELHLIQTHTRCERFISSVRRECLDHIIILNEKHLRRVIREYVNFFRHARPHQGIHQKIPEPLTSAPPTKDEHNAVVSMPILNGLHHDYGRAA